MATAEAVSVSVGHGNMIAAEYKGEPGVSPTSDSEDDFDSRHAQHHREDVRRAGRPLFGFSLPTAT